MINIAAAFQRLGAAILVVAAISIHAEGQKSPEIKKLESLESSVDASCGDWLWIGDEVLLATRCPRANGRSSDVVTVNLKTRKEEVIFEDARIEAFNEHASIVRVAFKASEKIPELADYHTSAAGELKRLNHLSPLVLTVNEIARAAQRETATIPLGAVDDGYLFEGPSGRAIWHQNNQNQIQLDVPFRQILAPKYLKFADKFILNASDSAADSATNSRLNLTWEYPYKLAPIRLLDRNGVVHEIAYPDALFERALAGGPNSNVSGTNFRRLSVTKAGLVFQTPRMMGSAVYMYQAERLYLIAGATSEMGAPTGLPAATDIGELKISPDGCNLAFTHSITLDGQLAAEDNTPRLITIERLCKH